jgi:hypothetical protein
MHMDRRIETLALSLHIICRPGLIQRLDGGGIDNYGGTTIIKKGSSISLNIADSDNNGYGTGGGIHKLGGTLIFHDQYGNPTADPSVINSIMYNNHLRSITGPLNNIYP